jgi:hypothetical protein
LDDRCLELLGASGVLPTSVTIQKCPNITGKLPYFLLLQQQRKCFYITHRQGDSIAGQNSKKDRGTIAARDETAHRRGTQEFDVSQSPTAQSPGEHRHH